MTTRADIAAALSASGISGVKGFTSRPNSYSAGMAWAQVASRDRQDGFWAVTWSIYVVVAKDNAAAADWYDANIQALRDCLQSVVYVDRDEPVAVAADAGTVNAILITARSE